MNKSLIGIFIGLVLLGGGFAAWYFLVSAPKTPSSVLDAFPQRAIYLIGMPDYNAKEDTATLGSLLSVLESMPMGPLLMQTRAVSLLLDGYSAGAGGYNDSSTQILQLGKSVTAGAYVTGAGVFDYLFVWEHEEVLPDRDASSSSLFEQIEIKSQDYFKANWYYFTYRNLFIGSFSRVLIEDAVKHLQEGESISKDPNFQRLGEIAGKGKEEGSGADISLFVNYKELSAYLSMFAGAELADLVPAIGDFAEWSAVDLKLLPQALFFNGYSTATPTQQLKQFSYSDTAEIQTPRVLPANTHLLWRVAGANSDLVKTSDWNSWMEGEWSFAITEALDNQISRSALFILKARDVSAAEQALESVSESSGSINDFEVRKITESQLISSRFGTTFKLFDEGYIVRLGRFIVIAPGRAGLNRVINDYSSGTTLANDSDYISFREQFPSSANCYLYLSPSGLENLVSHYILDRYKDSLLAHYPVYKKLQPIGIQFDRYRDLFFTSGYISVNGGKTKGKDNLWALEIDTQLAIAPQVVKNHVSGGMEVIAQDLKGKIYLVSRSGELLWSKQVDGPILGTIHQVDYYRNGKLQFLFNTENQIYLLDRNGKNVSDFPLQFTAGASNGLAVFDYDNNRDYRIFIAGKNEKLYGYYKTGKPLPGWSPIKKVGLIKEPLIHFSTGGKDYIVFANEEGTVFIKDRKGKNRLKPTALKTSFLSNLVGDPKQLSKTIVACDTIGNIFRIGIDGKASKDQFANVKTGSKFIAVDIDGKAEMEYAFINGNKLEVRQSDGRKIWEARLPDSKDNELFAFGDGADALIGSWSKTAKEWNMLDAAGKSIRGFPIKGTSPIGMGPLTGKDDKVLIGANGRQLIAVRLPDKN